MNMITPDLLRKYAQGNCTAVERSAVDHWLAEEEHREEMAELSPADHEAKAQIWKGIYSNTILKIRSCQRKVELMREFSYPVAAMLLVIGGWMISKRHISLYDHVVINNLMGKQTVQKTLGDLTYVVEPGSRCEVVMSRWYNKNNLMFCGAVLVTNHSGENSELRINTGSSACAGKFSDELIVRNGQTYLAMTDDKYNVIAATTDELKEGLPGPFSAKLHQRFSL